MSFRNWVKGARAKAIAVLGSLALILGVGASVSVAATAQENEVVETKADVTTEATFSRFYFCQGNWSYSNNARISKASLDVNFGASTLFSGTETTSSYAEVSEIPSGSYYYIDYALSGQTTLYFRFEQSGANVYPQGSSDWDFSGYIGNGFYPGFIYTITAGDLTKQWDNKQNKWCTVTVAAIGYIGAFNVNGGTRTASYDYKEFRNSASTQVLSSPTRNGYTFNGWLCNKDGFVTKEDGYYTASAAFMMTAQWVSDSQTAIAATKVRVWIGYNGTTSQVYYKDKKSIRVKVGGVSYSKTGTYYNPTETVSGNSNVWRRYDYFDIPYSCFSSGNALNVERWNEADTSWEQTSKFYCNLSTGSTYSFQVLYCPDNWDTGVITIAGLSNSTSLLATLALCGIHTCYTDQLNGHGGYENWYSVFARSSSDITNYMSNYEIVDYGPTDTSYQHAIATTYNAKTKFEMVRYMHDPSHNTRPSSLGSLPVGPNNDQSPLTLTLWIVLGAGVLGLGAIGTAYFVSKKKKRPQA